ncbi:cell division protein FtsQ/DivIB [Gemmiger sp.]|uniref:cell division protein FtsQ/DivIB n=1 Tax=Gemmiger sp. TaxID=2049027 RepID=UPI002A751002|nr:FtsQ-type POTRA domain-containing protein [Gemmiger sp.]MDY2695082.1 FtsQ-type POTRA domain-containing protein [Gemmiger sp.]
MGNNRRTNGSANQKRSLGSRVGLQKATPPPRRAAQSAPHPAQTPPRPQQAPPRPQSQLNPQKPGYRPGAPKKQRRVTQAEQLRRRRRRRILGVLAVLAVLAAAVLLSVNLLFKVTAFRIENFDRTTPADTGIYSGEDILNALQIEQDSNLFGFSTAAKAQQLSQALPYLDRVQVDIQLPGTVVVKVEPATERFAVPYDGGWAILSDRLKILRLADSRPDGMLSLSMTLNDTFDPQVGSTVEPASYNSLLDAPEQAAASGDIAEPTPTPTATATPEVVYLQTPAPEVLQTLLTELHEKNLFDGITAVDIADLSRISVVYQDRIRVVLGNDTNMEYKLRLAAVALTDPDQGLLPADRGTLDVSMTESDGSIKAYFDPGTAP